MDWKEGLSKGKGYLKKYRFVWLMILAGIFLMSIPTAKQEPAGTANETENIQSEPELSDELARILSQIDGAGKVEVLLSQAAGEQTIYQTDEDISSSETTKDMHRDTILITGSGREETGLIKQRMPPSYRGAVILCQGADRAGIRLSIVEAVMSITGLTSDHITVLKMK